ncbi:MAG: adenylyl-sulfate reductase subunit alpha, partial [Deltaproteobacteria bacterium]|nr:adenylyl-sulfate reductase subunit alpha [Deltaproteobacteria bacterium]
LLIIGGGAAGCYAALCAARRLKQLKTARPREALPKILLVEKAHIERSGCLAAGVNAINAYIGAGHSPEDYVRYAAADVEGIARHDLLLSIARLFNSTVSRLEELGLVIQKDASGRYAERGWRNVKINGENIKPLLASALYAEQDLAVLNKVNISSYIVENNTISGAIGFGVEDESCYVFHARAVICATGGAAGLYRPNASGLAGHTLWYPPFNTGAGYAMGILAGAEMTSLEMRFVALRCKGTIAPTGTLAQGAGARQLNNLGEEYEQKYGRSTAQRVYGTVMENAAGRGPCRLVASKLAQGDIEDLYKAYLNMAPLQTLKWLEDKEQKARPDSAAFDDGVGEAQNYVLSAEIEGTEPYIVGGHAACGYWVDTQRQTTINGLFAAGDVAGGCPQKYVSGAMAEGEIAVLAALDYVSRSRALNPVQVRFCAATNAKITSALEQGKAFLDAANSGTSEYTADQLEAYMQETMDEYAGGMSRQYSYNAEGLDTALRRIPELVEMSGKLQAADMRELLKIYELRERLVLCRSLIAHLKARQESRWPGFSRHQDYPESADEWKLYINSKMEYDKITIIYRKLVTGQSYEHSN